MAMMILQVVGHQNSGKTTLIEKCIKELTNHGIKVGTFKHHGHGGKPDIPKKDTYRHWEAGAVVSAVLGEETLLLQAEIKANEHFSNIMELYRHFSIDVLIIEGFKKAPYPKIVCIRDEKDLHLLDLSNVIASISSIPLKEKHSFFIKDEDLYISWIVNYVKEKLLEMRQ